MMYLGDFVLGQTLYVPWETFAASGGNIAPTGGTIRVYEAGNPTELATPGVTDTRAFDALTGVHEAAIAATGANGYAAGKDYVVRIVSITIDGVVVTKTLATFSIQNRSLKVVTDDAQAEITAVPPASTTIPTMIRALYALLFNKKAQTSTLLTLRNRADSATLGTAAIGDVGGTTSLGPFA